MPVRVRPRAPLKSILSRFLKASSAIQILKLFVAQLLANQSTDGSAASAQSSILEISFNRIKLDRLFWLCYFSLQKDGMEYGLEKLFSSDKIDLSVYADLCKEAKDAIYMARLNFAQ